MCLNITTFIQSLALSGALGFVSLSALQNKAVITSYLTKEEANSIRIVFGIIDYLIYLAILTLLSSNLWIPACKEFVSAMVTVLVVILYTEVYGCWRGKHLQNKNGFNSLTSREQAFTNPYGNWNVQADIFQLDGQYVVSGLVNNVNEQAGLPNDVELFKLPREYKANTNSEDARNNSSDFYIDTQSSLIYYLTYFSAPE